MGGGMHQIVIPRPVSMALRGIELVSAAVVAGIVGYYIHPFAQARTWPAKRFIFAEVWAAFSIIVSVLWLIPNLSRKIPWLADLILSGGWWTSFGLILKAINCGQFFSMPTVDDGGFCRNWKSVEVFCLLSGVAWFVTGLFAIQFVQARRRGGRGGGYMY